jgi:hypothetical protein
MWLSGVWYNLIRASEGCAASFLSKQVCKYLQTIGCHNVNTIQSLEEDPDLIGQRRTYVQRGVEVTGFIYCHVTWKCIRIDKKLY